VKCRSEGDGIGVDGECEDDKRGGSKEDDAINPAGEVLVGALRALVNFSNHCAATYFTESVLKVICCIFALDIPGPYRFDAKVLALGNLLNVLESDLSKGNLFRLAMVDEATRLLPNTEKCALEMFVRLLFSQISVDCASVLPRRERSQLSGRELEVAAHCFKLERMKCMPIRISKYAVTSFALDVFASTERHEAHHRVLYRDVALSPGNGFGGEFFSYSEHCGERTSFLLNGSEKGARERDSDTFEGDL
tara:strand:- start:10 stop:759 length:750 start_codon:yes stop_codon:yes gene_type:complete